KNIVLSLETEEIMFTGQEEYTEKIWENILSNAVKYTPDGGMIDIVVKTNDTEVTVTFSDTGIGIDEAHFEKLCERFYRVDSSRHQQIEGTGLGLSIVKQAVELHAGTINVSSKINEGTTFSSTFSHTHEQRFIDKHTYIFYTKDPSVHYRVVFVI